MDNCCGVAGEMAIVVEMYARLVSPDVGTAFDGLVAGAVCRKLATWPRSDASQHLGVDCPDADTAFRNCMKIASVEYGHGRFAAQVCWLVPFQGVATIYKNETN